MFKPNKYTRWYSIIVSNPDQTGYTETHHIVPRSLNGDNNTKNLVALSARQHFICHWLLTKMTEGQDRKKMINALVMMRSESKHQQRYATKITSRVYAYIREEYAQYISERNTGRIQPLEEKAKQKAAQTGRTREPFSEEWKANLKKNHKSKNPDYDCSLKEETKKKIGDKIRGRKQTDEEKKKRGESVKALKLKREKLHCIYCDQYIASNMYARWHGENCRKQRSNPMVQTR